MTQDKLEEIKDPEMDEGISDKEILALKNAFLEHFLNLGLPALNGDRNENHLNKETIRYSHSLQRKEIFKREMKTIGRYGKILQEHFAYGDEIDPEKIQPELVPVLADKMTSYLFRYACLLWSVPVSTGYGRRIRFLVRDKQNNKLIGLFALGDPVFNLKVRDELIGWDQADRRKRLVNLMDAYVVGAVPPYNDLLGGKLIASLMCSKEVNDFFAQKYKNNVGVISKVQKSPQLVLITVTSALGRSSLYNRLKLVRDGEEIVNFKKIGETEGYGHFQIPNDLFEKLRKLLEQENHPYANGHQFGQGPNWKLRVTRVGLKRIGLDDNLIRHGIRREVYASALASNYKAYLQGLEAEPNLALASVETISEAAKERWILPRAASRTGWKTFRREAIDNLLPYENQYEDGLFDKINIHDGKG